MQTHTHTITAIYTVHNYSYVVYLLNALIHIAHYVCNMLATNVMFINDAMHKTNR